MGLLKRIFSRKNKTDIHPEQEENWNDNVIRRDEIDIADREQREKYIKSCLEQMKEADLTIEQLTQEYNRVTSYLTDMEEIEALPAEEKEELTEIADKITAYEKEKNIYFSKENRMPDASYRHMERLETEAETGIFKLTECEKYQDLIRQDLSRLSGERHAFQYRKHEQQAAQANMKGMAVICACAFVACIALLMILHFMMDMDTQIGYILTSAATLFAIAVIYMKYTEASRELRRVGHSINRLILLQNKVKIRYVNNLNLREYYCVKYGVQSGSELQMLWDMYRQEKEEREKYQQIHEELVFLQKELVNLLRRFRIQDTDIWLRQTEAITNRKEMVEIRHNLILRRQKLRKQMEYNQGLAESAHGEVKTMAEEFPQYAREIMDQVSAY